MTNEPILYPLWKELLKAASEWEYGSFHEHREIATIIGIEYGSKDYYSTMTRVGEELATIGKRVKCVYNKGYYVLKPSEYPRAAYEDTKHSANVLKRGINKIHDAPVQKMDHGVRKQIEAITIHMGRTYVNLVSAATEVKEIAGIQRKQKMLAKTANGKVN
jgi:hypothetical protein